MRILLLTDIPPSRNYTSGLVINTWCDFLLEEGHEIYCAFVKDPSLTPDIPSDKLKRIKFLEIQKPKEYWGLPEESRFSNIRGNLRSFYHNNRIVLNELPQIASKVSSFAKKNNCEIILASIQGQTMTRLVRKISNEAKLDYVAQTWDPLDWWMKAHKFDPISSFLNSYEFASVVKGAKIFMSMSWAMSIEFEKKYRTKCVTNIPGLSKEKVKNSSNRENQKFIISFAGQLYAKEEFEVLVQALRKMEWKYGNKGIILNLYGKEFDEKYHKIEGININGYVEQDRLLKLLASSDLLYCPYWFSKEFEKPCKISFPAKLTSFLKTGKPVLMHAPQYASPRIFLEKNEAAYMCKSLDIDEMIAVLEKVMDDNNRNKVGLRGRKLFERYMTYDSMKKSLFVSLGLMDMEEIDDFESVRGIYKEK